MSVCISSRGEYSNHDPDENYRCKNCGVLDEEVVIEELKRLRKELSETEKE